MIQKIISCATHDFIEIACTFGYNVKLELLTGETLQGKAITTQISNHKKEVLLIEIQHQRQSVELVKIKKMIALQPNPHFDTIIF